MLNTAEYGMCIKLWCRINIDHRRAITAKNSARQKTSRKASRAKRAIELLNTGERPLSELPVV